MSKQFFSVLVIACSTLLAACNPTYNWRDYNSPDAPYRVMFPAKPASHTRAVDLNGLKVDMTMTAAEVEGVTFAVGTGTAPGPARAQAALGDMKTALLRNLGAKVQRESAAAASAAGTAQSSIDIDALGKTNGRPIMLRGHFAAKGNRFYQVIVMGPEKSVATEQVDQFISSFKPL
ncbi:MAG: hypothetical protein JWP72_1037 [Massilia sp.]|nr:hypothetical protein [Massilia sp.]